MKYCLLFGPVGEACWEMESSQCDQMLVWSCVLSFKFLFGPLNPLWRVEGSLVASGLLPHPHVSLHTRFLLLQNLLEPSESGTVSIHSAPGTFIIMFHTRFCTNTTTGMLFGSYTALGSRGAFGTGFSGHVGARQWTGRWIDPTRGRFIRSFSHLVKYDDVFKAAREEPERFWSDAAGDLTWFQKWNKTLDSSDKMFPKW